MVTRAAGLSRACSVTCPRCGTSDRQPAGATRWKCSGCRAGFVVGDGSQFPAPSLRPGLTRPTSAPTLRGSSAPPTPSPARPPLRLSGTIAFYGISEGPILTLPSGHRDGRETAGRPVLQAGCFTRGLHRSPVRLYVQDLSTPIATTEDHSLTIRDGRVALQLSAHVTSPSGQLLVRGSAGARLRRWNAVPVFDLAAAEFDHAFGRFHIREAVLTGVYLTDRVSWATGPVRFGR
ncbi:MAG: hypothetical protein U0871_13590 [Gemmataceae bacterium]